MQATAAGIAEGYLTKDLIYYFWKNMIEHYCDENPEVCKYVYKFVKLNWNWMQGRINNKTAYWHQTNLVVKQLDGIIQGYNKASNGSGKVIPEMDFV